MIQKIRTGDDPILSTVCKSVSFDESMAVANDLIDTLAETQNARLIGVGMAAPQIGRNARVVVVKPDKTLPAAVFIDPVIVHRGGIKRKQNEACLSYPGTLVIVERDTWVSFSFTDQTGKVRERTLSGFDARIFYHEMDHLNGICLVGDEWRREKQALADAKKNDSAEFEESMRLLATKIVADTKVIRAFSAMHDATLTKDREKFIDTSVAVAEEVLAILIEHMGGGG